MRKKILYLLIVLIFIILIHTISNAKYIIENNFQVANLNIDRTKPVIELLDIKNTNTGYEAYANREHIITLKVKVTEKNIKEINFNKEYIEIKVDNSIVDAEINVKELSIEEKIEYMK